jgi:hypothetical protein
MEPREREEENVLHEEDARGCRSDPFGYSGRFAEAAFRFAWIFLTGQLRLIDTYRQKDGSSNTMVERFL